MNKPSRKYIVPPIPDSVWQKPTHFIAFGFGVGTLPLMPGTFGTLIAVPFYLALQSFSLITYIALVFLITVGSIWLCDRVSHEIGVDDHQGMCLDEIVGYLITMINAPHGFIWIILGFLFFRFFDIVKPWPIRQMDRKLSGGFGAVIDDVFAGIYSAILLHILARIFI